MAGEQEKRTIHQVGKLTKPCHVSELENYLDLRGFLRQFKRMVPQFNSTSCLPIPEGLQVTPLSKQQTKGAKNRLYNCTKVSKSKKWMKNILVDDSDSNDSDFDSLTQDILEDLKLLRDRVEIRKDISQSKPSTRGEKPSTEPQKIRSKHDSQIQTNQPIQPSQPPSFQATTISDLLPRTILETEPLVAIKTEPPNLLEEENLDEMDGSHSFLASKIKIEPNSDLTSMLHQEFDVGSKMNITVKSETGVDGDLASRSKSVSVRKPSVEFEFKTEPEFVSESELKSDPKLESDPASETIQSSSLSDQSFSETQPSQLHQLLLPQSDKSLKLQVPETIKGQSSCPEQEAVRSFSSVKLSDTSPEIASMPLSLSSPSIVNTSFLSAHSGPSSSFNSLSKEMAIGTSTSIDNVPTFSSFVDSYTLDSLMLETKRSRIDSKMLDDIQYDATLPDEILQSELSSDASETGQSLTPSISDEVNFVNQLSDDTFNTDGSNGSILSQCASQPAHCVSEPTTVTQIKCMTAPTTPTNSRPNSPSMVACSSKSRKSIKTKSSLSHEVNMTVKRRKIWISIARKEIPRAQKRRSSIRRKLLATCRKISQMAVPSTSSFSVESNVVI